ncbi:hypothetical protein [Neobacillus sp. DY30]
MNHTAKGDITVKQDIGLASRLLLREYMYHRQKDHS